MLAKHGLKSADDFQDRFADRGIVGFRRVPSDPQLETDKDFNPNQPRDQNGRWAGGESVADDPEAGLDEIYDENERKFQALDDWVGNGYSSLRKADSDGKLTPRLKKFLDAASGLPKFKGVGYRGVTLSEKEAEATFKVGRKVGIDGVQSFSKSRSIAQNFASTEYGSRKVGVILKAKIKDGRDLTKFYPGEKEVLVRRENFTVKSVKVKDDTEWGGEKTYIVELH